LTREGLIRAIESIHQMDLGLGQQLKLDYSGVIMPAWKQ
jgi:hypothetical protein